MCVHVHVHKRERQLVLTHTNMNIVLKKAPSKVINKFNTVLATCEGNLSNTLT